MIDTVVMEADYEISPNELDNIPWTTQSTFTRIDGTSGRVFKYQEKGEIVRVRYNSGNKRIMVEVSIPKFLYGNNVKMITQKDIPHFLFELDQFLKTNFFAYKMHELYYWKVKRMDVCWNFQVGDAVKDYIQAFSQLNIPRYNKMLYNTNESIVWQNSSKRMTFYDKETEVRKRKGNQQIIAASKGILRFEANITDKELLNHHLKKWSVELLNEDVAKKMLKGHLLRLGINSTLSLGDERFVFSRLQEAYSYAVAQDIMGFILTHKLLGSEAIAKPSKSTYNRKMDKLQEIGLAPVFSTRVLPPLDFTGLDGL